MTELFAVYADAGPGVAASICFLLGLVSGSFSSVMAYRLPRGESIVGPRSCCPNCKHVLGSSELIPVLSYIWLRGRCRFCTSVISWRYPAFELSAGAFGLVAALAGGLGLGLASLVGLVLVHAAYGLGKRRRKRWSQSGTSLVEVLISAMLIAAVSASVFEFIQAGMRAERQSRNRMVLVGLARQGLAEAASRALGASDLTPFSVESAPSPYSAIVRPVSPLFGSGYKAWVVEVEVSCSCPAGEPLKMRGVVTSGP